ASAQARRAQIEGTGRPFRPLQFAPAAFQSVAAALFHGAGAAGDPLQRHREAGGEGQAHVPEHGEGVEEAMHFDFDRALSKDEAAALIFQQGKLPEGAQLEQGPGNTWVVRFENDLDVREDLLNHFNSHVETVKWLPSNDPTMPYPKKDLT